MDDIGKIADNRGRKRIHGGKVTNDAQHAFIRSGLDRYDREGFERDDNSPLHHGDDPAEANDMTADYGDNEPFETPKY